MPQILKPPEVVAGDYFGQSIASAGDVAVIGALGDNDLAEDAGAAYVYRRVEGQWSFEQKLTASDGQSNDAFGMNVAISGDVIAIMSNAHPKGAAYIFHFTGSIWEQQQKIEPSVSGHEESFDWSSVGMLEKTLVIGSWQSGSQFRSCVFVYNNDGSRWVLTETLVASDDPPGNGFGASVSLIKDAFLIGAPAGWGPGSYNGAAYLFKRFEGRWVESQKIMPSIPIAGNYFGYSVALTNDEAIVSDLPDGTTSCPFGLVHVFRNTPSGLVFEQTINNPAGRSDDYFGESIAASNGLLLVGSVFDQNRGAAHLFRRDVTHWSAALRLTSTSSVPSGNFGSEVALNGTTVFMHDESGMNVHVYETSSFIDCNGNSIDDECDIANGNSIDMNANHIPDECEELCDMYQWEGHPLPIPENQPSTYSQFGTTGAISGDVCVVGSHELGPLIGSAYVYRLDNGGFWRLEQILIPDDGMPMDAFGFSVCFVGEYIAVGSPLHDAAGLDTGAVYLFRFDGLRWVQDRKLVLEQPQEGEIFGGPMAANRNTLAVTVFDHRENGVRVGAVCLFHFQGASEQQELIPGPEALEEYGYFGTDVAINEDTLVIGSTNWYHSSGSVYVQHFDGAHWVFQQEIEPPDGVSSDGFGQAVAISTGTIMIGAPGDGNPGMGEGTVCEYTYDQSQWQLRQKLTRPGNGHFDAFGHSIAIEDNIALIGAPGTSGAGGDSGAAYFYRFDGSQWLPVTKVFRRHWPDQSGFGRFVALSGNAVLVSAHDGPCNFGDIGGSVSFLTGFSFDDCNNNSISDSCDIANGLTADANHNGVPDECESLCIADIAPSPNGNGLVNVDDLLGIINSWGPCAPPPALCRADIAPLPNGNGLVNVDDLLGVINSWGPCQ